MIEFKVINCPDKSQQASYQHFARELVIGREDGDLIIDDPGLDAVQLRITIEPDKATIENLRPRIEARLNGRPINGIFTLKERDNVTVARTTINFSRLDHSTSANPPEPYEHPQSQSRVTEGSKEKAILDVLELLETQAIEGPPMAGRGEANAPGFHMPSFSISSSSPPPAHPPKPAAKPPLPPQGPTGNKPPPLPPKRS